MAIFKNTLRLIIIIFQLLQMHTVNSQKKYNLIGQITDSISNERIPGVIIFIKELQTGCFSNDLGKFNISLPKAKYTIEFRFLGYNPVIRFVDLNMDLNINLKMTMSAVELDEIVVTDSSIEQQKRLIAGIQGLNIKAIENLPTLFGEKDVLKKVQMLPGITQLEEGSSSIYVRGSPSDQTLIVLDGSNIFNPSHIYGFVSIFNPDILKEINIYKGGLPSQYGGKIASLIEINTSDGNFNSFRASGGIGILSGRLKIEGPIVKNKISYFVAGRRSYSDLIIKPLFKNIYDNYRFNYYDVNSKVSFINDKNKVTFSIYFGNDNFILPKSKNSNNYGNNVYTLKWYHTLSNNIVLQFNNYYSGYNYTYEINQVDYGHTLWHSKIEEISSKISLTYNLNNNNDIMIGLNLSGNKLSAPNIYDYVNDSLIERKNKDFFSKYSVTNSIFLNHLLKFNKIRFDYGFRFVLYNLIGPGKVVEYKNDNYPTFNTGIDTFTFTSYKNIKTYFFVEPRINVSYIINNSNIIQLNYSKTSQFYQQISGYTVSNPANIFIFSDSHIKPQTGNQISIGYNNNMNRNFIISIEAYYKWMFNQFDLKTNGNLFKNSYYETEILPGKAISYGADFMIEKKGDRLNGWIAYAFLDAKRQIQGINNGLPYSPPYDIRHSFSIVFDIKIKKRSSLSANFSFHSGAAVTFPSGIFQFEGAKTTYYDQNQRNIDRMPDYHRLDISYILYNKHTKSSNFKSKWVFSIYNIYAKKNPYYYTFSGTKEKEYSGIYYWSGITIKQIESKMFYVFYIIPSISYDFSF
jgi:hypothetical protein